MKKILEKKTKNFTLVLSKIKDKFVVKMTKGKEIYDRETFSDIEPALSYFKETLRVNKERSLNYENNR
ncbi:MAG: hypothetical protein J6S85_03780 [Methanobrevibacter sp.]|nr:hypothetical protein [Methanobrevibacter sp.]